MIFCYLWFTFITFSYFRIAEIFKNMKSERLLDLSKEVFETNSDPRMRSHYVSH